MYRIIIPAILLYLNYALWKSNGQTISLFATGFCTHWLLCRTSEYLSLGKIEKKVEKKGDGK